MMKTVPVANPRLPSAESDGAVAIMAKPAVMTAATYAPVATGSACSHPGLPSIQRSPRLPVSASTRSQRNTSAGGSPTSTVTRSSRPAG
ncbi:MAG: hypothetical protein QOF00_5062 [Pseudonocardiales bacterium]|nr:hypothetical protein [Pseudonocardiales bacterium]